MPVLQAWSHLIVSPDEDAEINVPGAILAAIAARRARLPVARPLVVGVCGAQGSGKSTLAQQLVDRLPAAATLSLDDLYLTRAEREDLAHRVHPLLAVRGVPGTHDVALGLELFAALDARRPLVLPRFDKGIDDRAPPSAWEQRDAPLDTLVFEGWCIGAQPEPAAALDRPCNTRERNEDLDGTWRRYVNTALAGPYRALFARVDLMVFLAAPSFETVVDWRCEQEAALLAARPDAPRAMDRHAIEAFCALYERTTRALLRGMPSRADVVVALDAQRRCMHLDLRGRA
jgi:D-glycerate 3-kinase